MDGLPKNWDCIKQDGLIFHTSKKDEVKFRIHSVTSDIHQIKEIKDKTDKENYPLSISSLQNFNMYGGCYWYSEDDEQKQIQQKINAFLGDNFFKVSDEFKIESMNWLMQPFDDCPMDLTMGLKNKFAYAKVNLEGSNEQIKKDFALWLEQERKRRDCPGPKKNFSDADLDGWYESAVLPYLDLMFWSEIEDTKITQHVIAQAIFPDAYGVESETDPLGKLKTTKKKADYLMDLKTMKLLELQITD